MPEQPTTEDETPRYPADHAFIVQFQRGEVAVEAALGRVEHIVSGSAGRFRDTRELMEFVSSVLRAVENLVADDDASPTNQTESERKN
jgi:hypothetical protein